MKQSLQTWAALAVLVAAQLSSVPAAQAEGSKQLTPNRTSTTTNLTDVNNTIAGYLIHDSSQPFDVSGLFLKPNASDNQRLFIRMKPGETLHYGLQRIRTGNNTQNDVIITIKYRDGNNVEQTAATTTLNRNTASTNEATLLPQVGVIDNASQNLAGPRTAANPAGYNALTITYPSSATGTRDYWVEITQVGESGLTAAVKRSYYNFWDFTVMSASGAEQPGRLFSKFWAFTSGASAGTGFQNRLSAEFSLYTLVPSIQVPTRYFVKQVELAGMRPVDFFFVANSNGTNVGTTFAESRKSVSGASASSEYANFVNNPDISLWPSADSPLFTRTAQAFCNPTTGAGGVAFTTTSGEQGSVNVLIDINGNGVQDTDDVLLTQNVTANTPATIVWDGKNKAGTAVAIGTTISLSFTSFGSPVNYPLYDAEGNPDGLRIQNVRPTSGAGQFFDRLYWDDTNFSTTNFPDQLRLNGEVSTLGVHKWGDASNSVGDGLTINTWSYGFITPIDQVYVYNFICDNDGDLVADATDLDDDNDGILDVQETNGVNPQDVIGNTLVYLNAAYSHPVFGAFRDLNTDGINDWFDTDLDGIPNHFDLDADGDGIPDAVEANGNVVPTYSFSVVVGTTTNNRYKITSSYDAAIASYVGTVTRNSDGTDLSNNTNFTNLGIGKGVGRNGLPDAVEATPVTYGGARGNPTLTEDSNPTSGYSLTDADADSRTNGSNIARNYNFLDIDSDNDGITDEIEFQNTAAYNTRKAQLNFNADANGNGLRDAYDPSVAGGTAIGAAVNSGGSDLPDIFDNDSDGDNNPALTIFRQTADWSEGFDGNQNGVAGDEILAKARQFAINNPSKASYYPVTSAPNGNASTLSVFLQDADNDDVPNFLDITSTGTPYYHDDNFNGLVDLYDPAYGGTPSTAPKRTASQTDADFRNASVNTPLPVTLLDFQAQATGNDVVLHWATAQELNNTGFDVERSADGNVFTKLSFIDGQGTTSQRTNYTSTDKGAGLRGTTWFYRLRQVDRDGTASFSPVRMVSFIGAKGPAQLLAYPNPAHNAIRVMVLGTAPTGSLQVFDAVGRLVHSQLAPVAGTESVLPLTGLPAGIYVLRCGTLSKRITVE